MSKIQNKYSKTVEIGSYPFFRLGRVGVSIVIRSIIKHVLVKSYKELKKILKNKKSPIYGEDLNNKIFEKFKIW